MKAIFEAFFLVKLCNKRFVIFSMKLDDFIKFIYSEKAAKFYEIFTLLLTTIHIVKSKVKILQNFVTFSEYMNFL